MPVLNSKTRSRAARIGIALGLTIAMVTSAASPGFAAAVTMALSAAQGPSGGGNTITATTVAATFTTGIAVEFQYAGSGATPTACSTTYATPVAVTSTTGIVAVPAGNVKILSPTKIAITVPNTIALASGQTTAKYNICVYSGTTVAASGPPVVVGSALLATAIYTIAAKAVITSISPASGPAMGNTTITVTGSNFPATGMTGTLAGLPLGSIVVAANGNSFTATTPAHAAGGPFTLTVSTSGGTTTKNNFFSYTNGIVISPNTAPNTRTATDVDLQGVGFGSLTFTATGGDKPDDPTSHTYLVPGAYDASNSAGHKLRGEIAECGGVLVVSDTELICTLNLAMSLANATGTTAFANTTRTVADAATTSGSATLTSNTANFTSADIGELIVDNVSNATIPAGTSIIAVNSPTSVTLSATASATASGATVVIGGTRSVSDAVTAGTTTVTSATAAFSPSDVGRAVTGTRIAPGTTIASVTNATTAVLSQAATGSGTGGTLNVGDVAPVPVGTYTMTVVSNGAVAANTSDPNYTQSIISSGSTFTVADY